MVHPIIQEIEKEQLKAQLPDFNVGDTVEVRVRIKEGDKERIQPFIGVVIAKKHGGSRANFTVRRIVQGEGIERVFPLHSPNIVGVRVRYRGEVRRAKLYYLRSRKGKAARIKGRVVHEAAVRRKGKSSAGKSETGEAKEVQEAGEKAEE